MIHFSLSWPLISQCFRILSVKTSLGCACILHTSFCRLTRTVTEWIYLNLLWHPQLCVHLRRIRERFINQKLVVIPRYLFTESVVDITFVSFMKVSNEIAMSFDVRQIMCSLFSYVHEWNSYFDTEKTCDTKKKKFRADSWLVIQIN